MVHKPTAGYGEHLLASAFPIQHVFLSACGWAVLHIAQIIDKYASV